MRALLTVVCLFAMVFCTSATFAAAGAVVDSSTPMEVVLPENAGDVERLAARELSRCVGTMLGAKLTTVTEADAHVDRFQFHIGRTKSAAALSPSVERLAEDGFAIRSIPTERRVLILGSNPRGTLYGVYSLLEDDLGCRWPEPGAAGEVIPKCPSIDIGTIDRQEAPSFPHRTLRINHEEEGNRLLDYVEWQARQRMNYLSWHGGEPKYDHQQSMMEPFHANGEALVKFAAERGFIIDSSSHSFQRFAPPEDLPLNMASPETQSHVVREISDFLERNPFVNYVGLWPADGWNGNALTTPEAIPMDSSEPRYITKEIDFRADEKKLSTSNTYADFVNHVQEQLRKSHPKATLTLIAYNKTLLAPSKVRCASGQQVQIAFRRSYSHGFGDPASTWNHRQCAELDRWLAACDHVLLYEYYQTGNLGSIGRPLPRTIAADLKFLQSRGVKGTVSQSRSDLFRVLGPNYYAYAKCAWNVNANVEHALDDYYAAVYGPAAASAKEYFDTWERMYNRGGDYFRYDWNVIVPLFDDTACRQLTTLVEKTKRDASKGSPSNVQAAEELSLSNEAFSAFMRFGRTGKAEDAQRCQALSGKYPFIRADVKVLEKAKAMHGGGL